MTNESTKKIQPALGKRLAPLIAWLAGALEALLLARLVARLIAARPENPGIALLYDLTAPLVGPLAALDLGQPPFGASLERATLALLALIPLGAYLIWIWLHREEG